MQLSLQQAADLLGKTRRQVVYMIEQGRLPAQKVGGRWVVERTGLLADATVQQRASQREAHLKAAVEEALTPANKTHRYTLRDLKAVQLATPIYQQLVERGAGWEQATAQMRLCLDQLAVGCHRYDRREKTTAYRAARDAASLAAMDLWLRATTAGEPLLEAIEQDLMAALAGLLRRSERGGGSE
ncbi:MAG: helix-turn-helix domain-containing protein [Candidatus Competibacteraceae bacterium]